jgi:hypothetical protein
VGVEWGWGWGGGAGLENWDLSEDDWPTKDFILKGTERKASAPGRAWNILESVPV